MSGSWTTRGLTGLGEAADDREARPASRRRVLCPVARDGFADLLSAQVDLRLTHLRAGDGEHERRRVAEVLDELYGPRPVRQIGDGVEFERDVVELLGDLAAGKVLIQVHVNNRNVGTRDRADLFHVGVLRHLLFDLPGHQLLDLLRVHSRPEGDGDGGLDRRVRVFALGHALIAVKAPDADADQHDPGDVPLLDEEARDVALALVNIVMAVSVCHIGLLVGHAFRRRFMDQPAHRCARFS